MAMSKKDYQALARAIYITTGRICGIPDCGRPFVSLTGGTQGCAVHGLRAWLKRDSERMREEIITAVASALENDNPRFDHARFIEACETGQCKGMRKAG